MKANCPKCVYYEPYICTPSNGAEGHCFADSVNRDIYDLTARNCDGFGFAERKEPEIDEGEPMNWKRVEDEPPPRSTEILVCVEPRHFAPRKCACLIDRHNEFHSFDDQVELAMRCETAKITHWCNIEGPEGGK